MSATMKAILERMLRAGLAAVLGAYLGGDLIFDVFDFNSLKDVAALFISAAIVSLAISLGITATTSTGPALNKAESFPSPPEHNDEGLNRAA